MMKRRNFGNLLKGIVCILSIVVFQKGIAQENNTLKINLEQAIVIALDDNLSVKVANSEIERINYLKKEAWYTLFPSVSASGQYTNNIKKPVMFMPPNPLAPEGKLEIGSRNAYSVGAQASLPLFSMGIYRNIQLSELELQDVLEGARSSKINLIKEVKNSFYGTLMMESSYDVLKKSNQNAVETSDNVKNMYEQGLASEYDKIRAEVAVRNILPNLVQLENAVEMMKRQLKALLSLPVSMTIIVDGNLTDYESDLILFSDDQIFDLSNNADLKKLDIQTRKLRKQLQLLQTQRIPTLGAFASFQSQAQNEIYNWKDLHFANSLSVGLNLNIPVFNGFTKIMKEKQLKVTLSEMQMQYDLAEQNIGLGVQNSLFEIKRSQVQLESNKEAAMQAEKGYEIAKVRYNTGMGTILELNDAENAMTQAKLNYNQSLYDFLKARNEMETLLGIDMYEEENMLDR